MIQGNKTGKCGRWCSSRGIARTLGLAEHQCSPQLLINKHVPGYTSPWLHHCAVDQTEGISPHNMHIMCNRHIVQLSACDITSCKFLGLRFSASRTEVAWLPLCRKPLVSTGWGISSHKWAWKTVLWQCPKSRPIGYSIISSSHKTSHLQFWWRVSLSIYPPEVEIWGIHRPKRTSVGNNSAVFFFGV